MNIIQMIAIIGLNNVKNNQINEIFMCITDIEIIRIKFLSNFNRNDNDYHLKSGENILSWKNGCDYLIQEVPVALVYNGISHSVMMATPQDLEDFALGFSLAEGIINSPQEIYAVEVVHIDQGIELQIELASRCFMELKAQRRSMAGRTGCGICGTEQLSQAIRTAPPLPNTYSLDITYLPSAIATFNDQQSLKAKTGATHGAGFFSLTGELLALREDIGRHIALDKILGWHAKNNRPQGFIMVSSRGSYEMVQKTAKCGVEILVTMSAVSALAVEQANLTNLTLLGFAREERANIYTGKNRIIFNGND